jgi:RecA-family ATPase
MVKLIPLEKEAEDFEQWRLDNWANRVRAKKYPPWLVETVFRADSIVLVSGAPKVARKTFFALACAIAIATGRCVGDVRPQGTGNVLLVLEEGSAHATLKRLEQMLLLVGYESLPKNIYIVFKESFKVDREESLDRLLKAVEVIRPVLVVLDPLAQVMSGDENSQEDMRLIVDAMKALQKAGETDVAYGPAIMLLCHLNKTTGTNEAIDIDSQLRGSSALAGCYDVHIAIRGSKEKLRAIVRAKEEEELEYALTWQGTFTPRLVKKAEDEVLTMDGIRSKRK